MNSNNYKKPDLNAIRYRPDSLTFLTNTLFKDFKTKFPEYNKVSNKDLSKIIKTFNTNIWKEAINYRDGIELPEGLGYIFIGTCLPPTGKNIDQVKSVKYGKQLKNTNLASDGFLAKIFYSSYASKYKYEFRKLWKFKGCRNFTRSTSKAYRENWKLYVQVDKNFKISALYKKTLIRQYLNKQNKKKLNTYNEFDLD
jgi:hypothetical protein